ncbi:MAG: hypothetical protein WBP18_00480 [Paracoccaceae bacterium]
MPNNQDQISRFKEAARQLETDNDADRFDAALKKIAKAGKKPEDAKKDD